MMLARTPVCLCAAILAVSSFLPAQEPPPRPAVLVLGGPTLDPEAARSAASALVSPDAELLVPPIPAADDPARGAFLPAGAHDGDLAQDLAAAYRLAARQVVRELLAGTPRRPVRTVIAFYDGAPVALSLVRAGLLAPRHLVLLDPDAPALAEIEPPPVPEGAAAARPHIDVFLSQGAVPELESRARAVRAALEKWSVAPRVFVADLRGAPLETIAREMAWPLRGLRTVRVSPDALRPIEPAALFGALEEVDTVFAGELHGNAVFHRFTLGLLEAMDRGTGDLLLSLEMFERDVQPILDRYLAGEIDETAFLAAARPWPSYPTDYRPLIEHARRRGIPVIAANVPRRLAARVARDGSEALAALEEKERGWIARDALAASPPYRARFAEVMKGMAAERLERMYAAQCLKDDTMAESIHDYLAAHPEIRRVLHVNGTFHSSFGLGTVHGLRARRPDLRAAVVTCRPVANPRAVDLLLAEPQDDYLVFSAEPPPRPRPERHPTVAPMRGMPPEVPQGLPSAPPAAAPARPTSGESAGSRAGSAG
ncbi:MAG: ChaN family lipoprotein [Planctomycetes bacterium]|nr:ChaN family lipoprotein [Planctomycetota bacterium]